MPTVKLITIEETIVIILNTSFNLFLSWGIYIYIYIYIHVYISDIYIYTYIYK